MTFKRDSALLAFVSIVAITPIIFINTVGIPVTIITLTIGMLTGFAFLNRHGNYKQTGNALR